jgi:hypothetical protein
MPERSEKQRAARDPRLDFFRGMGMFIILIAHIPWNPWTEWIPARFGFSDAADMFVFCSGMASGLAFAKIFDVHGWLLGALRIVHRVWQVYWAHIGSFLVVAGLMVGVDLALGGEHYAQELSLQPFFAAPKEHLVGLLTLTYVPNYFDILPMYLAILAMVPAVMALARIRPAVAGTAVLACWGLANAGLLTFTADHETGREWFFNPFAWQLTFFTGFAFVRGWLPAPPIDRRLIIAAVAVVLLAAPVGCQPGFNCYAGFGTVPALGQIHDGLGWLIGKPNQGPLRFVHFLATAYLAYAAVGPHGRRLRGRAVDVTRMVGRQTLAVFLTGLVVAQAAGMAMDVVGRGILTSLLVNAAGCAVLIAAAKVTETFKSPPWRKAHALSREPSPGQAASVEERSPAGNRAAA